MTLRKLIMRFLLKLMWSVGGAADAVDGLPRVRGADMEPHLGRLEPGDAVLIGNNGGLSHVMLYVGAGEVVHSMATEMPCSGKRPRYAR